MRVCAAVFVFVFLAIISVLSYYTVYVAIASSLSLVQASGHDDAVELYMS